MVVPVPYSSNAVINCLPPCDVCHQCKFFLPELELVTSQRYIHKATSSFFSSSTSLSASGRALPVNFQRCRFFDSSKGLFASGRGLPENFQPSSFFDSSKTASSWSKYLKPTHHLEAHPEARLEAHLGADLGAQLLSSPYPSTSWV